MWSPLLLLLLLCLSGGLTSKRPTSTMSSARSAPRGSSEASGQPAARAASTPSSPGSPRSGTGRGLCQDGDLMGSSFARLWPEEPVENSSESSNSGMKRYISIGKGGPYSYLVAVQFSADETLEQRCSGVILQPQWILTAARCARFCQSSGRDVVVRTGNATTAASKVIQIVLHDHDDQGSDSDGSPGAYGLALLKLEIPLELGDNLKSIPIAPKGFAPDPGSGPLLLLGLGPHSTRFRPVGMEQCKGIGPQPAAHRAAELLCAAPAPDTAGPGRCYYDVGGPLVTEGDRPQLVGMMAVFYVPCDTRKPAVFLRMSEVYSWVMNTTATPTTTTPGIISSPSTDAPGLSPSPSTTPSGVIPPSSATHQGILPSTFTTHSGVAPPSSTTHPGIVPSSSTTHPGILPSSTTTPPGIVPLPSTSSPGVVPAPTTAARRFKTASSALAPGKDSVSNSGSMELLDSSRAFSTAASSVAPLDSAAQSEAWGVGLSACRHDLAMTGITFSLSFVNSTAGSAISTVSVNASCSEGVTSGGWSFSSSDPTPFDVKTVERMHLDAVSKLLRHPSALWSM